MGSRDHLRSAAASPWLGNAVFILACGAVAGIATVIFTPGGGGSATSSPSAQHDPAKLKPVKPAVATNAAQSNATAAPDRRVSPSFDCTKVTGPVPRLVCDNPVLATLDQDLATAYQAAMAASPYPELLSASERVWVVNRNAAQPEPATIAAWYLQRIAWLKSIASPQQQQETAQQDQPTNPPAQPASAAEPTVELGSGFFVTTDGKLVTNAHVVRGCYEIGVRRHDGSVALARMLATDTTNDLALAQMETPGEFDAVQIRAEPPKLGEGITLFGFPLPGLLASSGNLTTGNVTALSGVGDDVSEMQISAPVQPGNSGGPALDAAGNLIGVVVAKLDGERVASITHDIPQNVNFAIKAAVLTTFLSAHGVESTTAGSAAAVESTRLAETAQSVSVQIVCKPDGAAR